MRISESSLFFVFAGKPEKFFLSRLLFLIGEDTAARPLKIHIIPPGAAWCILCELTVIQLGISAILLQQCLVSSLFDDIAVAHIQDQISICNRRQSVGDDKAGSVFHQGFHRFSYLDFRPGVHAGRRFVQDDDRRIAEEDSRYRQKLSLADGNNFGNVD